MYNMYIRVGRFLTFFYILNERTPEKCSFYCISTKKNWDTFSGQYALEESVRCSADLKNKLMGVVVYF